MTDANLRVLLVHNRYLQPGGEDVVVQAEAEMLKRHGHEVEYFGTSNEAMLGLSAISSAAITMWNGAARAKLAHAATPFHPDVVHFHNTFPFLSPAVYYAWPNGPRPAVVQTLHNYRLVCPAGTLMRAGKPCELCVGRFAWPGVVHACYRTGRGATLATATMVQAHHTMGTWARKVDAYIALTEFTREVFVRGGLPRNKIHVKPNFVAPDPGTGGQRGRHFLFVGRLEEGKGIRILMDAWRRLPDAMPLRIIGSGPLAEEVAEFARGRPGVEAMGQLPRERVMSELKTARALIVPMLWYENFPLAVCEAMATGCPVIASDLANVRAILDSGNAGVFFPAGNVNGLCQAVRAAIDDHSMLLRVAAGARAHYESNYTEDANYRMLRDIYAAAMRQPVMAT